MISSLVLLGLVSVVSCYDDSALWDSLSEQEQRIKDLETRVEEMNTNLTSLQTLVTAMKQGDYITDVKPLKEGGIEVGYQITFFEHGTITIYHGKDGASSDSVPELGVKRDVDGNYYWTLNGEWMLDEKGEKLPVSSAEGTSGVTPELKIENEKWYVSYDEGRTWTELGRAVAENVSCLFKDVTLSDDVLVLTMSDGTVLSLPVGDRMRINLGAFDAAKIQYGDDIVIPYTVEGPVSEASVFVVSDIWMFSTEVVEETALTGTITIRQEDWYDEEISGKVVIFATSEDGTTVSKIIRLSSGVLRPAYDNYNDVFSVGRDAATIEFTVATNRDVNVNTNADWITYVDTRAVEEKTLVFDIKENEGTRRKTYVEIASGDIDFGFTVTQKGLNDGFSINVSCEDALGGWWNVNVDTLFNKAGQTIHEALGYASWDELALAAGDWNTVYNRTGEVILTGYDLYSGEPLPYDEQYRDGLGFCLDADGYLTYWDMAVTSWGWNTIWNEESQRDALDKVLYFGTRNGIHAGDSYAFGIMFIAPDGEARIDVTIDVTEYVDPELGLYDTPAAPGKYEFTVRSTIDLDSLKTAPNCWGVHNFEMAEHVKSTLGMTSLEIFRAIEGGDIYSEFVLNDGNRVNGREGVMLDVNGFLTDWNDQTLVGLVSWNYSVLPDNMSAYVYLPSQGHNENGMVYWPAIYKAIGHTVTYDYVIRYEGYELIFTHELTYEGEPVSNEMSGYALKLINQSGNGTDNWSAQVWYEMGETLENGRTYTLSMNVKGSYEYSVGTWLKIGMDGEQIYHMPGPIPVTTEWTRFETSFIPEYDDIDRFIMNFGDYPSDGIILMDDVSLTADGDTRNIIRNGDFEEGHVDGWRDWYQGNYCLSEYGEGDSSLVPVELSWYLVGTFNSWVPGDEAYKMTKEGDMYVFYDFVSTGDEVKFNAGDWAVNRGGYYSDGIFSVWQDGQNLIVPAGTYDVYLNQDGTEAQFVAKNVEEPIGPEVYWSKKVVSDLWEGYDAGKKVKLARYGDYILIANGAKVGALNPEDGSLVATYDLPFDVHGFCTDDAGNILFAADAAVNDYVDIYKVSDLYGTPELFLTYNTGNYYSTETGNIRVKGDVNDDAVITAVAADGAGGAVIMWEVVDGVCSDWYWTSVPYTAWSVSSLCCAPAGNTLADGLFYIGYGGDYNLHYAADPVRNGASEWMTSYVTGSSWMENYNCISTLEFNGSKYAAILMGCHFNYDSSDVIVLNVDDPASASLCYYYYGDPDVDRDESYANLDWTGLGTYSDVLLLEYSGELLAVYVDSNYGVMTCMPCIQQ